jgi:ferredoxin
MLSFGQIINNLRGTPAVILSGKDYFPMTHVIVKDECIQCGACESECPDGAISMVGEYYEIDPAKCQDCGNCVEVCPTSSINKA